MTSVVGFCVVPIDSSSCVDAYESSLELSPVLHIEELISFWSDEVVGSDTPEFPDYH